MFTGSPDSAAHFKEELVRAKNILTTLQKRLDVGHQPCKCCAQHVKNNWDEFKVSQSLQGAIGRLAKSIEEISEWTG